MCWVPQHGLQEAETPSMSKRALNHWTHWHACLPTCTDAHDEGYFQQLCCVMLEPQFQPGWLGLAGFKPILAAAKSSHVCISNGPA